MTEQEIMLNYTQAVNYANDLNEKAQSLRTLANQKYAGTLQDISANWTGENAQKYLAKGNSLKDKIINSAKELDEVAESIRRSAKRVRDADMQALQAAQQRDYGGLEAAEAALQQPQDHEVPDALRKAHANHDEPEPA